MTQVKGLCIELFLLIFNGTLNSRTGGSNVRKEYSRIILKRSFNWFFVFINLRLTYLTEQRGEVEILSASEPGVNEALVLEKVAFED